MQPQSKPLLNRQFDLGEEKKTMWPLLVKIVTLTEEENKMNAFYATLWLQVKDVNMHIWEREKYKHMS